MVRRQLARPRPYRGDILGSVTCAGQSQCWAVGHYGDEGGPAQTLIMRWDGTSWIVVTSPNATAVVTGEAQRNRLAAVTCVSASDCWAVGSFSDVDGRGHTLVEHWDGETWTLANSPNATAVGTSRLAAVTCLSAADCWAVGYHNDHLAASNGQPLIEQTLIERWDGSSWAVVSSPNTSALPSNILSGVTCAAASDCWAVGHHSDATSGIRQTLIQRWNGSSWAVVSSPSTSAAEDNSLSDVTCAWASDCWAVGSYVNGGGVNQTLMERFAPQ